MDGLSRIFEKSINEVMGDCSKLEELGKAYFRQSLWHYTDIIMESGEKKKEKFRIKAKIGNRMKKEDFCRALTLIYHNNVCI